MRDFFLFRLCELLMLNNEFEQQQHLSDDAMDKLRNVIKTKIAGELTISEGENIDIALLSFSENKRQNHLFVFIINE